MSEYNPAMTPEEWAKVDRLAGGGEQWVSSGELDGFGYMEVMDDGSLWVEGRTRGHALAAMSLFLCEGGKHGLHGRTWTTCWTGQTRKPAGARTKSAR